MNNRKLLPALSVAAGTILIIIGLFGLVSYIITLFESSKLADKSLIFWYLPFLLFGIVFLVTGILFTVFGFRSLRYNKAAYKTNKVLLIILFAIILILISFALINSFFLF